MYRTTLRFLPAAAFACLAACSGKNPPGSNDQGGSPDLGGGQDLPGIGKGTMAIVNGSPAPMDVYMDGVKTASSPLAYKAGSGNMPVDAGSHRLEVRAAGAASTTTPAAALTQSVSANGRALVVIAGRAEDAAAAPTALSLRAFVSGAADAAAVKLRVVHAAPGAPAVDLARANAAFASNVTFGAASNYATITGDLAAGTQLAIRPAGKALDLAFAQTPAAAIARGSVVTAIAVGEIDPLADEARFLDVITVDEASGAVTDLALSINTTITDDLKPSFVFLHASPDTSAIDLRQTGVMTALATNVAYRAAAAVVVRPTPGELPLELRTTAGATAFFTRTARFLPGFPWLIVLRGQATPPAGTTGRERGLSAFVSGLALSLGGDVIAATEARVRLVHLVPDAPAIEIADANNVVASAAAYLQPGAFTRYTLPAADSTLNVRAAGTTMALYRLTVPLATLNLLKGQNVDLVATGTIAGDVKVLSVRNTVAAQLPVVLELTTTKL